LAILEAQRNICVKVIEPALDMALVTGHMTGKLVAALCIGQSLDPPYRRRRAGATAVAFRGMLAVRSTWFAASIAQRFRRHV